jgi:HAD superfamily hydrolase (TIGR01509 family)
MESPRYRWLFFDLFDTLCTVDEKVYYEGKRKAAEAAGVKPLAFLDAWKKTAGDASVGRIRHPFERAEKSLESLGVKDRSAIVQVAKLDVETIQECVHYYDGAEAALEELKQRKFSLGLISNATSTTAFAVSTLKLREHLELLVFSYEVGAVKPDPAIFQAALHRASCPPGEALFIGDGANRELDAAAALGFGVLCMDHAVKALSFRDAGGLSSPDHPKVSGFSQLLELPYLQEPKAEG